MLTALENLRDVAFESGLVNAENTSAHSHRRCFATEVARLGASMPSIQRHGRWKSTKTVFEYIEAGRQVGRQCCECAV